MGYVLVLSELPIFGSIIKAVVVRWSSFSFSFSPVITQSSLTPCFFNKVKRLKCIDP